MGFLHPPAISYSTNDVDFILENGRPGSGSLYHNLNLTSAYSHADACARDATTNQGEWCTVDYIFYGWDNFIHSHFYSVFRPIRSLLETNSLSEFVEIFIFWDFTSNMILQSNFFYLYSFFLVWILQECNTPTRQIWQWYFVNHSPWMALVNFYHHIRFSFPFSFFAK